MEIKDWINLFVEVICNGVVLAIFGKWLDIKMKKSERKEKTHDDIVNLFFEELAELNKALIHVNYITQFKGIDNINEIINLLEDNVLNQWIDIIIFYDTYKYDLEEFESYYDNVNKSWIEFVEQTTPQMLGKKLQEFKEANQKLMEAIRKKS